MAFEGTAEGVMPPDRTCRRCNTSAMPGVIEIVDICVPESAFESSPAYLRFSTGTSGKLPASV